MPTQTLQDKKLMPSAPSLNLKRASSNSNTGPVTPKNNNTYEKKNGHDDPMQDEVTYMQW